VWIGGVGVHQTDAPGTDAAEPHQLAFQATVERRPFARRLPIPGGKTPQRRPDQLARVRREVCDELDDWPFDDDPVWHDSRRLPLARA
jgi:hypothetical protein